MKNKLFNIFILGMMIFLPIVIQGQERSLAHFLVPGSLQLQQAQKAKGGLITGAGLFSLVYFVKTFIDYDVAATQLETLNKKLEDKNLVRDDFEQNKVSASEKYDLSKSKFGQIYLAAGLLGIVYGVNALDIIVFGNPKTVEKTMQLVPYVANQSGKPGLLFTYYF